MSNPMFHQHPYMISSRCTKCGQEFWDAHVCAEDIAKHLPPVSKAEALATAWDNYAAGDGFQRTAEETAIELRRLEAEVAQLKTANDVLHEMNYAEEVVAKAALDDNRELLEALKHCSGDFVPQEKRRVELIKKHGG